MMPARIASDAWLGVDGITKLHMTIEISKTRGYVGAKRDDSVLALN